MISQPLIRLLAVAMTAAGVTAQTAAAPDRSPDRVELVITAGDGKLVADVTTNSEPFHGAVVISASPVQRHYLVDLPPFLADFRVVGFGYSSTNRLQFRVPTGLPVAGATVYGQALILDAQGIAISGVIVVGGPDSGEAR